MVWSAVSVTFVKAARKSDERRNAQRSGAVHASFRVAAEEKWVTRMTGTRVPCSQREQSLHRLWPVVQQQFQIMPLFGKLMTLRNLMPVAVVSSDYTSSSGARWLRPTGHSVSSVFVVFAPPYRGGPFIN